MIKKHNKKIVNQWIKFSEGNLKKEDVRAPKRIKLYITQYNFEFIGFNHGGYSYIPLATYHNDNLNFEILYININKNNSDYKKIKKKNYSQELPIFIETKEAKRQINRHILFKNNEIKTLTFSDLYEKINLEINKSNIKNIKKIIEYAKCKEENVSYTFNGFIYVGLITLCNNNNLKLFKLFEKKFITILHYFILEYCRYSIELHSKLLFYILQNKSYNKINIEKNNPTNINKYKLKIIKPKSINNRNIRKIINKYIGRKIL